MAVEAGGLALVKAMLNSLGNNVQGQVSNLASKLEGRKWLVHAALKAENKGLGYHFSLVRGPFLKKLIEFTVCLSRYYLCHS